MKPNSIHYGAALTLVLLGNASLVSCFAPPSVGVAVLPNSNSIINRNRNSNSNSNSNTYNVATNDDDFGLSRASSDPLGSTPKMEADDDSLLERKTTTATTMMSRRSMAAATAFAALGLTSTVVAAPQAAHADEYGRESEAQFLVTGETVMICTKRGILGKCEKTEKRTVENENDKSEKYFREPTVLVKRKDDEARASDSDEGNVLIERLKKQSEENAEKNEQLVFQRTQMNDAAASFGPFDGNVLILNEDGKGFTLLANPQAMRLKKAGFIQNKKFIKQPTQEEIDDALESPPNILDRIFGSSSEKE